MHSAVLKEIKYQETMRTETEIFMDMNIYIRKIGPKFQMKYIRRIRVRTILRRAPVGII